MSKQLTSINDFSTGIVNDTTAQGSKGFADMLGLDIWKEDGVAQINKRLELDTTTGMTTRSLSNTTFDGETISGNDSEEIWYNNTGTTWSLLHTNTNPGDNNDIATYQKYLIYASDDEIGRSVNTTIGGGFDDNPTWGAGTNAFDVGDPFNGHYFKEFNNRLYISDSNIIAELDGASDPANPGNWVFTSSKFVLPEAEVIKSLEVIGDQLAIGTESGNYYEWDGASDNASTIVKSNLGGIHAMIQLENTLFAFIGIDGTIYRFNGADFKPVFRVPNVNISSQSYVRKAGVRRYRNGFIFCLPFNGIYVINRADEHKPLSMAKYGNLSGGQVINKFDGFLLAIYIIDQTSSDDAFIVGYDFNGEKIDRVNVNKYYRLEEAGIGDTSAAPYLETIEYQLRDNNGKPNKVQGVQGMFRNTSVIGTDRNNILVEYRFNQDQDYTILGDIGRYGIDIDKILKGIGKRVTKITFKVKFGGEIGDDLDNTKLIQLKIF